MRECPQGRGREGGAKCRTDRMADNKRAVIRSNLRTRCSDRGTARLYIRIYKVTNLMHLGILMARFEIVSGRSDNS